MKDCGLNSVAEDDFHLTTSRKIPGSEVCNLVQQHQIASVAAATDLLGRLRKFRLDPLYDHVDESRQAMVKECIQASQAWAIQLRAWVQSIESSIPKLVA